MTKREHQAMEYAVEAERPVCRTCHYYIPAGESAGECHRYPPSPARMSGAVGEHAVTAEDNICGEYRSRKAALWAVPAQMEKRNG